MKINEGGVGTFTTSDGTRHYAFNEQMMDSLFKGCPTFIQEEESYLLISPSIVLLSVRGVYQPTIVFEVSEKKYTKEEAKKIIEDYIKKLQKEQNENVKSEQC